MLPDNVPEEHINYIRRYKEMDEYNKANRVPEKREFTKNEKLITLLSSIAILLVIGGYAANKMSNKNPSVDTEVPSTPIETQQSPSEKTTSPVDMFNGAVEQYNDSMERYANMSVDKFESLPMGERLSYSQYLIDQTVSRGTYNVFYGDGESHKFEIEPTKVSKDNTGQEIISNFQYVMQMSELQFVEGEETPKPLDVNDSQKMLSYAYYEVGKNNLVTNDYVTMKSHVETLAGPIWMKDTVTATNATNLETMKIGDKEVDYKVVTYKDTDGTTLYARFVYREFKSYDGTYKAVWLLDNQSDVLNNLRWTIQQVAD